MTDLTPERRAGLRHIIKFRRNLEYERVSLLLDETTALLDAADERDRLVEVESRLSVLLWRLTNGRLSKTDYSVEFMEQEIEECLAKYHESDIRDERDRLAATIERVQALVPFDPEGWEDPDDFTVPMSEIIKALDTPDV